MLIVLYVIVVLAVLFVAAVVATREGDVLADAPADVADLGLPDGPMEPEDVAEVRFGLTLRGYRMSEVDSVLARLASELAVREHRIAELEQALVDVVEPELAKVERELGVASPSADGEDFPELLPPEPASLATPLYGEKVADPAGAEPLAVADVEPLPVADAEPLSALDAELLPPLAATPEVAVEAPAEEPWGEQPWELAADPLVTADQAWAAASVAEPVDPLDPPDLPGGPLAAGPAEPFEAPAAAVGPNEPGPEAALDEPAPEAAPDEPGPVAAKDERAQDDRAPVEPLWLPVADAPEATPPAAPTEQDSDAETDGPGGGRPAGA